VRGAARALSSERDTSMRYGHGRSGLVARLGKVPVIWLALAASGPLGGCSGEQSRHGVVEPAGSIGLELTAAPGVTLNSVTYTISGNSFTKTGVVDTSASPIVRGTIGGIPAGKGYTLTLTATSVEGDTTFTGSAKFNVTAGGTATWQRGPEQRNLHTRPCTQGSRLLVGSISHC